MTNEVESRKIDPAHMFERIGERIIMNFIEASPSLAELNEAELDAVGGGHPHETITIECEIKDGKISSCKDD